MSEPTRKSAIQLSVRIGLAAAAAVGLGQLLHLQQLSQLVVTVALVTDLSPVATRRNALSRLAGTAIGAALGAVLTPLVPSHPLVIGGGVLVAMLLAHLLRLRGAARVAGFVCGIVLLGHSAAPWAYATSRLAETAVGITVCVLVSFVPLLLGDDSHTAETSAAASESEP